MTIDRNQGMFKATGFYNQQYNMTADFNFMSQDLPLPSTKRYNLPQPPTHYRLQGLLPFYSMPLSPPLSPNREACFLQDYRPVCVVQDNEVVDGNMGCYRCGVTHSECSSNYKIDVVQSTTDSLHHMNFLSQPNMAFISPGHNYEARVCRQNVPEINSGSDSKCFRVDASIQTQPCAVANRGCSQTFNKVVIYDIEASLHMKIVENLSRSRDDGLETNVDLHSIGSFLDYLNN